MIVVDVRSKYTVQMPFIEHDHMTEDVSPLAIYYTPGVDYIGRHVQRQLMRNEAARFYHHRTRKCIPSRKLRRDIQ